MSDLNDSISGGFGHTADLPEFLRMNKHGGIITQSQRIKIAEGRGLCVTCGRKTHKVTAFRTVPLNDEHVRNGICLYCHPEERCKSPNPGSCSDPGGPSGKSEESSFFLSKMKKKKKNIARRIFSKSHSMGDNYSQSSDSSSDDEGDGDGTGKEAVGASKIMQKSTSDVTDKTTHKISEKNSKPRRHASVPDTLERNSLLMSIAEKRSGVASLWADFSASSADAWDVVKEMRDHPDDVNLLARKCHELRSIGSNQAGSLYEVVEVMKRHPEVPHLKFAAIGALWSLSADGGDDRKSEIIEAGAGKSVVDALKAAPWDVNLVMWGMGALSSLAEGMGARADLEEEEGVVDVIKGALKLCNTDNSNRVLYWVFRCLSMMVLENDSFGNNNNNNNNNSRKYSNTRLIRDAVAVGNYSDTFFNTSIATSVLDALRNYPLDAITMEWGLKFLAHLPLSECEEEELSELIEVCAIVMKRGSNEPYPTLQKLACGILCVAGNSQGSLLKSTPQLAKEAFNISMVYLTSCEGDEVVKDLMLCTISNILEFGDLMLEYSDSKKLMKICFEVIKNKQSTSFRQEVCCCIMFRILSSVSTTPKTSTMASKASDFLKKAIFHNTNNINLTSVALFALGETTRIQDCDNTPTIAFVMTVMSKLPQNLGQSEFVLEKRCALLAAICKTKAHATCIELRGGLQLIQSSMQSSSVAAHQEAVNLMYKLSLLSDGDISFSVEMLQSLEDVQFEMSDGRFLIAKSLHIVATSTNADNPNFSKYATLAVNFTKKVMETFPDDAELQRLSCLSAKKVASTAQNLNVPLDMTPVIHLVFDARRRHGVKFQEITITTLWALTGVHYDIEAKLLHDIALFAIEIVDANNGTSSHDWPFNPHVVTAGMALLTNLLAESVTAIEALGTKSVELVNEVILSVIYACLDNDWDHAIIFKLGFSVIQRLCSDDAFKKLFVTSGGIVAVIDGMAANREEAIIQEFGCNILRRLAAYNVGVKLVIAESDGVDVILEAILNHNKNEGVIKEAFHAISVLSVVKQTRFFIAQQGTLFLVLSAMENLLDSAPVQKSALDALCLLCSDEDHDALASSDIFKSVKDSLDRYPENLNIQQKALVLLRNLSMKSDVVLSGIEASGCLEHCVRALKIHRSSPEVINSALSVLLNMSERDVGRQFLLQREMIELIIDIMMMNIQSQRTQILSCSILCFACQTPLGRALVMDAGGVEAVLFAMFAQFSSESVQDDGCRIFSSFSMDPLMESYYEQFGPQILDAILMAMSNFLSSVAVSESAVIAVRNMTMQHDNMDFMKLRMSRVRNALEAAMNQFPGEFSAQAHDALMNAESMNK